MQKFIDKKNKALIVVIIVILVGISLMGVVSACDASNPGDILYPIDLSVENFQRNFISDSVQKAEFEIEVMDERVQELETISNNNDSELVSNALKEVEKQENRLQKKLQEMNQLRTQNQIQIQKVAKVMQKLEQKISEHNKGISKAKQNIESQGNFSNFEKLDQIQNKYLKNVDSSIQSFENNTEIQIKQNQENQGEDNKIQNQNSNQMQQQKGQ